jgi:uncharacterized phiE125 gp8 family phage protein
MKDGNLYSLIPFEEFKAIFGVDDREDKLTKFCLVTSTLSIEEYCKRKLLIKTFFQIFKEWQDLTLFLNEFPVREIIAVSVIYASKEHEIIEPDLYNLEPLDVMVNIPYLVNLSPAINRMSGIDVMKVIYKAGYFYNDVPKDLSAACMELAAWNMSRYKGRRVGMTGNVRGNGKEGEHFEMSMPENVKLLLEPYKRRVI